MLPLSHFVTAFPPETGTPLSALQTFPLEGESPKGEPKKEGGEFTFKLSVHLASPFGSIVIEARPADDKAR